jgi:hypothetical protein
MDKIDTALPAKGIYRLTHIIGDKKRGIQPLFPVSRSKWLGMVKDGAAPPSIKLGKRAVGWKQSDIHEFLDNLGGVQ